jgi:N-acetylglucosamine kinase-like BadF-type ATPase
MPRVYFVGIDAGGSGTRAALVTEDGLVLALGSGGPSGVLGDAAGLRTLRRALSDALAPIEAYLRAKRIVVDVAGPDASDTDAADVRYPAHDNPKNASEPVHVNSPATVDTQARASAARRTARATRPGEVGARPSSEVSPSGPYDVTASGPCDVNAALRTRQAGR